MYVMKFRRGNRWGLNALLRNDFLFLFLFIFIVIVAVWMHVNTKGEQTFHVPPVGSSQTAWVWWEGWRVWVDTALCMLPRKSRTEWTSTSQSAVWWRQTWRSPPQHHQRVHQPLSADGLQRNGKYGPAILFHTTLRGKRICYICEWEDLILRRGMGEIDLICIIVCIERTRVSGSHHKTHQYQWSKC